MATRSPRRVVSVIHGPVFGGAHNQLVRLDPLLRDEGFETVAVVPPEAEEAARRIEAAGIEVIRLPLSSFRLVRDPRRTLVAGAEARRNIGALRQLVRRECADIVQVHGVINLHAGIAAARQGVPVVWQLLDTRAPMALRRAVMPVVTRIAGAITSWGRGLAEAHPGATQLGDRLVVVFPPVDPALAPDAEARKRARAVLRVPPGAPLVGTIGVRNATKGHEHLVRAAARVKRSHPDAVFRVLGSPSPTHAALMASIEREAEELGILGDGGIAFVDPEAEATSLLQAFDVFALSSVARSEGMPTAILEAMACAQPVVATRVGSVDELVDEGVTGLIVEPKDDARSPARSRDDRNDELRSGMGRPRRPGRAQRVPPRSARFPSRRRLPQSARAHAALSLPRGRQLR